MYLSKKQANLLIILCFMVYTAGYIGRLNYNASLVEILSDYGAGKAEGGLVSSFFFFAYGIGQFVNGFLSKKYNPRIMLFLSLFVSAVINMTMPFLGSLSMMKWAWLLNGFFQSVLWSTIIKTLSNYVPDSMLPRAILTMSTTVAIGTFCAYGLSAICIAAGDWKQIFYIAGGILFAVSLIWFFAFGYLKKNGEASLNETSQEVLSQVDVSASAGQKKLSISAAMIIVLCGTLLVAIANGFVKDGTITWTPSILYEEFNLDKAFSVILTFLIPLLSIFGAFIASKLHKKITDFHALIGIFYITSFACLVLLLSIALPNSLLVFTLALFIVISCAMAAINNILTSMIPLFYRKKISSGMVAGIINTFCYIGSTLSSITLGLVADNKGWTSVFIILMIVSVAAVAVSLVATYINKLEIKKKH